MQILLPRVAASALLSDVLRETAMPITPREGKKDGEEETEG